MNEREYEVFMAQVQAIDQHMRRITGLIDEEVNLYDFNDDEEPWDDEEEKPIIINISDLNDWC